MGHHTLSINFKLSSFTDLLQLEAVVQQQTYGIFEDIEHLEP
jgi:hypothetical protein